METILAIIGIAIFVAAAYWLYRKLDDSPRGGGTDDIRRGRRRR